MALLQCLINAIFVCSVYLLFIFLFVFHNRSKSLSDIPMVYPVRKLPGEHTIYDEDLDTNMANEWNQEDKRRCSVAAKDSEAQWQDVRQEKLFTKQSHGHIRP